jgi:HSP20 family molecular chaperone IbpA
MTLLSTFIPSFARASAEHDANRPADLAQTVKPAYEVKETPEAWGLTVYLPGVAKDGLELTAEEGQFRVVGRRAWKQPEGWTSLYRETGDAAFELILTHDNAVDAEKVSAELSDGVLRVSLPKPEAIKPRKIAVS